MNKRIAAAVLWFLACWTAGSFLTYTVDISPLVGPIVGLAAAGLFAGDPRRIIWVRQPETAQAPSHSTTTADPA
jgi:hypothetical protein